MTECRNDTITQANVLKVLNDALTEARVPMTAGSILRELTGRNFPEKRHANRMADTLVSLGRKGLIKRFRRTSKEVDFEGKEITVVQEGYAPIS